MTLRTLVLVPSVLCLMASASESGAYSSTSPWKSGASFFSCREKQCVSVVYTSSE